MSEPEEALAWQLRAEGLTFDREYRFHESRLWRLDFWFADAKLAVELDGGGMSTGEVDGRLEKARCQWRKK